MKKILYMLVIISIIATVSNVTAQAPLLPYKWKNFGSQTEFVYNPTDAPSGASSGVGNAIVQAMATWDNQVSYSLFKGFSTDYNRGFGYDGVNAIVWQHRGGGVNAAFASTQPYVDLNTGKIIEMDIALNNDIPWRVDSGIGADVQGVLTHEFGHAIGLNEDYNCPLCTMFPFALDGSWARTLEQGDIDAVKTQYCIGDQNADRTTDRNDFVLFGAAYNSMLGDSRYNMNADINGDGYVNRNDFVLFSTNYRKTC